jgi:tRNA/rRNA methyltransferase
MMTMGIARLVLVAPARFPDPEAAALAAGATAVLDAARVVATLDEALAGCALAIGLSARPREYAGRVLSLRDAALAAITHADAGDVAIVFGTEMSGLSNDELARCGIAATIPANDEFSSLNVAAAVQVAAYELRVASGEGNVWSAPRFTAATHDEIEALYAHARRTLTAMRFLKPDNPRRLLPRLRRLFGRAALEREEVNILRGILARVDEFVGKAGKR